LTRISDQTRIDYEAAYHDDTHGRVQARLLPHHLADGLLQEAAEYFYTLVRKECPGRDVLAYGCGEGSLVGELLSWGAVKVTGIDISPGMIERASARFHNVEFHVMDCEEMAFADASFDLIVGTAVLHHLDVEKSAREIARVLRPGGRAVFLEPLGHNPFINAFRRFTPGARTPFEHPLRKRDLALLRKVFPEMESREFVFTSLFLIPLRSLLSRTTFERALRTADRVDRWLGRLARYWCWITVLDLHN